MHSSNIGYCMVTSYIFKLINHFTVFSKYSLLFVRLIYRYFMYLTFLLKKMIDKQDYTKLISDYCTITKLDWCWIKLEKSDRN